MGRNSLDLGRTLVKRIDELDIAVATQAEHLRHFFLDKIVDDDLGPVERIALRHRFSPYRFDFLSGDRHNSNSAETAQARGTLFLIMLYVNLYCGILTTEARPRRRDRRRFKRTTT